MSKSPTLAALSQSAKNYVPRKFYDKADVDILVDGGKTKQNALLLGPRGTGKTTLIEVVANKLGRPLITVPCHTGATAESLIGQWVPNEDGKGFRWMDGLITVAVRKGYVLFLDEVNSLKPEVAFCIHGLLDHRRELILQDKPGPDGGPEVIEAHPDFFFCAAGNPFYEGVRVMNEAFRDRFQIQLKFGYVGDLDIEALSRTTHSTKLGADQVAGLNAFIQRIRKAHKEKVIFSDISTRAFKDLQENLVVHGFTVARTLFLARFDDEQEITAVRTAFKDVWDDRGKVQASVLSAAKTSDKQGRAGRFAANAGDETVGDANATV